MDSPKIQKIIMEFTAPGVDGTLKYSVESLEEEGLRELEMPFDDDLFEPRNFEMKIYGGSRESKPIYYDMLDYIIHDPEYLTQAVRLKLEKEKEDNPFLKNLDSDFFKFDVYRGKRFPEMHYYDITERDMFGNEAIKATDLSSNTGVWAWTGLRKLQLDVDGIIIDRTAEDHTTTAALYWTNLDNEPIAPVIFEHNVIMKSPEDASDKDTFFVYYNTNVLGDEIDKSAKKSQQPLFIGNFELHHASRRKKEAWSFPVKISVNDTRNNDKLESSNPVSIDFGTSSTCAAFTENAVNKLLTLSGPYKRRKNEGEQDKEYENPTNLMIYNWQEVRNQWQDANKDLPLVLSKLGSSDSKSDNAEDADYDSGYTVTEVLKNVDDEEGFKKSKAILTDLKNLPIYLAAGYEKKFVPLNDRNGLPIHITSDVDKEDDSTFNPIKFYGYILGRVINNPAQKKYFTNYQITFPVSYDQTMRDKIRDALGSGLLRSLPKPVREKLDLKEAVKTNYEESVACLGAIIPNQLRVGPNDEPVLFSVFDLGGGTLDTSYGILQVNPEDDEEQIIHVLGTGGDDKSGGERLIHKLAFKIYADNKSKMEEKDISFILPAGMAMPPDFDRSLLPNPGDPVAENNVFIMTEKLVRYLFKYNDPVDNQLTDIFPEKYKNEDGAESAKEFTLTLHNRDDKEVKVTLEIEDLDNFLKETIKQIIEKYKKEMESYFYRHVDELKAAGFAIEEDEEGKLFIEEDGEVKDLLDEVKIFLGGNASRQHYVKEIMLDKFPLNSIEHIGDTPAEMEKHEYEKITGKTAVAFGQLNLPQFTVRRAFNVGDEAAGIAPFNYYVGYHNTKTGEDEYVIQKNENSRKWQRANRLDKNTNATRLFYSKNFESDSHDRGGLTEILSPDDPSKTYLYLRVYDKLSNALEYRLGGSKEEFKEDEPSDPTKVLVLQDYNS